MSNNPQTFWGKFMEYISIGNAQLASGHSNEHGMAEFDQPSVQAKAGAVEFIQSKYSEAVALSKLDPANANYLRGQALHTVADSMSPSHRDSNGDPKIWAPTESIKVISQHGNFPLSSQESLGDLMSSPGKVREIVQEMRTTDYANYQIFTDQSSTPKGSEEDNITLDAYSAH